MKYTLFALLILLGSISYCRAQTFRIGNAITLEATAFNRETKNIYAIYTDSIRVFYPPEYTSTRLIPINPPDVNYTDYPSICLDSTLYFVSNSGGLVYHLENDSIVRIDHSFDHKMQINSTLFSHNDTLMRYGGYGFWSDRNFITYFSKASREWEILPPLGSHKLPRGSQNTLLLKNGSDIYIFSGISTNEFNPLEFEDLREVWRFDLNTKRWEHLGKLQEDLSEDQQIVHLGDRMLLGLPNKTQWVLVDPAKNTLDYYNNNGVRKGYFFDKNIRSFYDQGKFYLIKNKNPVTSATWDGELVYVVMDEEDFLEEPDFSEKMYAPNNFPMKPAIGALGAIGVLLLVLYGRKRYLIKDKVQVTHKSVRYKGKTIAMDPTSLRLLNLLLRSENEVHSQDVLDLVEKPNQSSAHIIRVKNQAIENLNFQLKTLLGISGDPIQSRKSEEDKRIKTYQIQSQYFIVR